MTHWANTFALPSFNRRRKDPLTMRDVSIWTATRNMLCGFCVNAETIANRMIDVPSNDFTSNFWRRLLMLRYRTGTKFMAKISSKFRAKSIRHVDVELERERQKLKSFFVMKRQPVGWSLLRFLDSSDTHKTAKRSEVIDECGWGQCENVRQNSSEIDALSN